MKFAQWLEAQNNNRIMFGSFSKDGTVTVYIDGTRYVYITDAVYHGPWYDKLEYIRRKKPAAYQKIAFGILQEIKDMVKRGRATQEQPKPQLLSPSPTSTPKPPIQRTLF